MSARARGGVVDGADHRVAGGEDVAVLDEQQVHHEADDFTRGEVIAGRFVGGFVEAPDQVFEDQTHGDVVDLAWVQVDLGELAPGAAGAGENSASARATSRLEAMAMERML